VRLESKLRLLMHVVEVTPHLANLRKHGVAMPMLTCTWARCHLHGQFPSFNYHTAPSKRGAGRGSSTTHKEPT